FTTASAAPPSIESESGSKNTSTDATVEAQINPGDAPAGVYYQFQIAGDPNEYKADLACPPEATSGPFRPCIGAASRVALPIVCIPPASGPTSVGLDLASATVRLSRGVTYRYRVLVAEAIPTED